MATVREYFQTDFPTAMRLENQMVAVDGISGNETSFEYHYLYDTTSFSKFAVIFLPETIEKSCYLFGALENFKNDFEKASNIRIASGKTCQKMEIHNRFPNKIEMTMYLPFHQRPIEVGQFIFTNLVYMYCERIIPEELAGQLSTWAEERGLHLICRDPRYAAYCDENRQPRAFISHDSRDKDEIARRIATTLQTMRCPVWYDEYYLSGTVRLP